MLKVKKARKYTQLDSYINSYGIETHFLIGNHDLKHGTATRGVWTDFVWPEKMC